MSKLGSKERPLLVAIVGSGPSGFYAAEALFKSEAQVQVDILERLPSPYGLVRSGVAPDHQKLKQAINLYQKISATPEFNLIANVTVGRDISVEQLCQAYHAVIFTNGAESDRKLGVPGEELTGSHTATEFVGWYNGHPDYRDREFDLSHEVAVIIGQGNVAADVSRILSKTIDELKHTDIAQHALDVLAESRIKEIHVIGRRGPAQAKFTPKELREFGELSNCNPIVTKEELRLNAQSKVELEEKSNIGSKKIYDQFYDFAERDSDSTKSRNCYFKFLMSPKEFIGQNKLEKIIFEKNSLSGDPFKQSSRGSGELVELNAGIVFRSIGYHGVPLANVPFNESWGTISNEKGRVVKNNAVVKQLYTAGWIKRGPSGIIGTNRACSVETVECLLQDITKLDDGNIKSGAVAIYKLLNEKNIRHINYADWLKIDQHEIDAGQAVGKPREKITRVNEMLAKLV